jgi:hypothetical protein
MVFHAQHVQALQVAGTLVKMASIFHMAFACYATRQYHRDHCVFQSTANPGIAAGLLGKTINLAQS